MDAAQASEQAWNVSSHPGIVTVRHGGGSVTTRLGDATAIARPQSSPSQMIVDARSSSMTTSFRR